jgi:hypothetical protein
MVIAKIMAPLLSWMRWLKQSPYALPVGTVINASLAVSMLRAADGNGLTFPAVSMALVAAFTLALTGRDHGEDLPD